MAATTSVNTLVPCPPCISPKATVTAKTADYTITAANAQSTPIYTNTGATGNVTFTLPAASAVAGCVLRFAVLAAQTIQLDPGTGKIYLSGSGVADKYCQIAGVIGNYADIYSDGVDWMVVGNSGVLTKES